MSNTDVMRSDATSSHLRRRARTLAAATIAGTSSRRSSPSAPACPPVRIALVGFGVDSTIEVSASISVLWLLATHHDGRRERLTSRAIALSFAALSVYVVLAALSLLIRTLISQEGSQWPPGTRTRNQRIKKITEFVYPVSPRAF